jgi:hypothetical protein
MNHGIGSKHNLARVARGHSHSLFARQAAGVVAWGFVLQHAFIDIRGVHSIRHHADASEEIEAAGAGGGKDEHGRALRGVRA